MSARSDPVTVELRNGVQWIRLTRPEARNALSRRTIELIADAVRRLGTDERARVGVVAGSPGAFSAGGDLKEAEQLLNEPDAFRGMLGDWHETFRAMEACPKPIVAAVDGVAVAGGLELALACDVILASTNARFGDGHIRHGLVPAGGGSQRLPEAIGTRAARWLMYSGDLVDASAAAALGLAQRVLEAEGFEDHVQDLAERVAGHSGSALTFMKRMTSRSDTARDERLATEADGAVDVIFGADARAGYAEFSARGAGRAEGPVEVRR